MWDEVLTLRRSYKAWHVRDFSDEQKAVCFAATALATEGLSSRLRPPPPRPAPSRTRRRPHRPRPLMVVPKRRPRRLGGRAARS